MNDMVLMLLLAIGPATVETEPRPSCAEEVRATATAYRLADLPKEIRDDLNILMNNEIGDSDSQLLQTDAPVAAERNFPTARFFQALFVNREWFVQFEVSMFAGVRTIGYVRDGNGGFRRWSSHYFGGPACETIKAALNGVTTPGGFNF